MELSDTVIAGRLVLAVLLATGAGGAAAEDRVFRDSFEPPTLTTPADAARFLTQATFGPTPTETQALLVQGMDAWFDAQVALPPTLSRPALEAQSQQGVGVYQGHRIDRWLHQALEAPDQLRQRVAFALSELFVVSDGADNLTNDWRGMAEYQDVLVRGAFGSHRDLLGQITFSPQMGKFLSHYRNRKATGLAQPDENFAREILQLFSIGLVWLDDGHVPVPDAEGRPIPTYTQDVVTEFAQVFTGLALPCTGNGCDHYTTITAEDDGYAPMVCFARWHDTSEKQLLALSPQPPAPRVVLPGHADCEASASDAERAQCADYCAADVHSALDLIAAHPNIAPFLAHHMIQRLVKSQPSPAYVARVARAFRAADESRNLEALVRAVLSDPEARRPGEGKLREPLLRVTALWRAFDAQPGQCESGVCMGLRSPEQEFAQRPLGAASVFNFFAPSHAIGDPPLLAPEFQILDESTGIRAANELWSLAWNGYSADTGDFASGIRTRPYLPPEALDDLPRDSAALIDELDARLLYGSMSGSFGAGCAQPGSGMRGVLYQLLECDAAVRDGNHRKRVLGAVHLIVVSPEFAIQR